MSDKLQKSPLAVVFNIVLAVALVLADDSVSYVTNFFLENDPDDEDAPSALGFAFKGLGLGVALGALVALIVLGLESVIASPAVPSSVERLGPALSAGGVAAAVSTFVSFATTPIYLAVLRRRDEANKETSGFTLSLVSMLVAVVVFLTAVLALAGPLGLVR